MIELWTVRTKKQRTTKVFLDKSLIMLLRKETRSEFSDIYKSHCFEVAIYINIHYKLCHTLLQFQHTFSEEILFLLLC